MSGLQEIVLQFHTYDKCTNIALGSIKIKFDQLLKQRYMSFESRDICFILYFSQKGINVLIYIKWIHTHQAKTY